MGAQGSQSGMAFRKEAEFGVKETGEFTGVNFTAETFGFEIKSKESNHIRPDRQTSALIPVGASCEGGIETELQAGNIDFLMPSLLWAADWIPAAIVLGTVSFAVETGAGIGGKITFGAGDTVNLVPGNFFFVAGASAANNGIHRVKGVVGKVVQVFAALATQANVAATVTGSNIRNGVTRTSHNVEKANYDIDTFFLYLGAVGASFELGIESEEVVKFNCKFIAKEEQGPQDIPFAASVTNLLTTTPFSVSTEIEGVYIDELPLASCDLQKLSINYDNKTEGKKGVGFLGSCDIRAKTISVSGKISLFFSSKAEYLKYKNSTGFSIRVEMIGSNNKFYVFALDRCQYDKATANVKGKDDDIFFDASFKALVGNYGCTLQITKG